MSVALARPSGGHLLVLFAVSGSMLALEILLVRLFEFSHWHHFAGLAVSLALLGLGTAGTCLALQSESTIRRRADLLLLGGTALQVLGTLAVLYLHSTIALRPLFAAWDGRELARLLLVDFVAFLPFFGAGLAIGVVFARWPGYSRSIYATNLLGSGLGSLGASLGLAFTHVESVLAWVALAPALTFTIFTFGRGWRMGVFIGTAFCVAGLAVLIRPPAPALSDFKALSRVLDLPDVRILRVQSGLPGKLTVLRSDSLRVAPGLSLEWPEPVAAVDAAVVGSDRLLPLPRRFPVKRAHTDASLGGLPFLLRRSGPALILGTSAWQSQVAAGNREIVWVESDPRLLALAVERGLAGPSNTLVEDSAYRYLATTDKKFAVIAVDAAYEGADAAAEDYLMTVDGLAVALAALKPDGLLALPLELSVPPNRAPRALATLQEALSSLGANQTERHVAVLRGLQDIVLLASPRPLAHEDLSDIRVFAERWRFDLAWLPGITETETNRYHRLDEPVFYLTAKAVFEGSAVPESARWFAHASVESSKPYFWRSLIWDRVPELVQTLGRQRAASYLDWTLLMTAVTATLSAALAFVFIVLPLGRLPPAVRPFSRVTIATYFIMLGLGYLLLELAFFQRAILFLGEPVLTAAVVFGVFLLGSGAGAATAPSSAGRSELKGVFLPIAAALGLSVLVLWYGSDAVLEAPRLARIALISMALAPLAWAMGRPFPWALRQLAGQARWVPWAWGINGFASVVAASLATLISLEWGQPFTLGVAVVCYVVAALTARCWVAGRARPS